MALRVFAGYGDDGISGKAASTCDEDRLTLFLKFKIQFDKIERTFFGHQDGEGSEEPMTRRLASDDDPPGGLVVDGVFEFSLHLLQLLLV